MIGICFATMQVRVSSAHVPNTPVRARTSVSSVIKGDRPSAKHAEMARGAGWKGGSGVASTERAGAGTGRWPHRRLRGRGRAQQPHPLGDQPFEWLEAPGPKPGTFRAGHSCFVQINV